MTDPRSLPPVPSPFQPEQPAQDHDHTEAGGAVASTDVDDFKADDYEYVRIGGVVRAIPKASVQDEPATATQDVPKPELKPVEDPHFYVWLANGEVRRVKQSDLPAPAGTNAQYGHWQEGNKVFLIVNVFPVEDIVKEEK